MGAQQFVTISQEGLQRGGKMGKRVAEKRGAGISAGGRFVAGRGETERKGYEYYGYMYE